MAYLYMLTAPNGNSYVGITASPVEKRWAKHFAQSRTTSPFPIHAAIRKYGWDNIVKRVLVEGSFEYIKELEIKAIAAFNTFAPFGYNLTKGGDGNLGNKAFLGKKHSEESKALISKKRKEQGNFRKGVTLSDETKAKMSEAQKGNKAYWFGKKLSPETKAKMSAAHRKDK